jgi:Terminase large subunit, T4likevirus-type, N-terminal
MIEEKILARWKAYTRKLPYGRIGFGYKVDPDNGYEVLPDLEQIAILEQSFDYIESGSSLREVCEWTSQKLLKSMVHQTIVNLYNKHRRPYQFKKTDRKIGKGRKRSKEELKAVSAAGVAAKAKARAEKLRKEYESSKLKPEDFPIPPEVKEKPKNLPHLRDPDAPPVVKDPLINIVFEPNPGPQSDFLSSVEEEVLYGGSAGGGKSYAMIADPMRYFHNPNFVGLLLRRTNDELRELKWETQKMYPKLFPGAKWKDKDSMWVFPSGAKFWMTYLERDDDVMRYQGQAFTWIGVDELTQYATSFAWTYLKSRLRTSDPELKKSLSMRATTNPGGPGHHWVKKMFIDPAPAGEAFWATDIETNEVLRYPDDHEDIFKRGKPLFKRRFIPARLKDNPYLYNDGAYERSLQGLPEQQRRKLLDGDWSIMEGAAFAEFSPKHHVCKPFDIPTSWRRFRAADYGYSSPACVLWFAIDPAFETLYVYKELYGKGMTGQDLAFKVQEMERDDSISYGILDSSVWHQRGHFGPSIAEEMIAAGCRWRPSDRGQGSRVAGKNRLHELLKVTDTFDGPKPGIIFFDTCRQIIADLPTIPSDPGGTDDIDSRYPNDHSYDALRYGIMSRPRSGSALDWGSQPRDRYSPIDSTFGY